MSDPSLFIHLLNSNSSKKTVADSDKPTSSKSQESPAGENIVRADPRAEISSDKGKESSGQGSKNNKDDRSSSASKTRASSKDRKSDLEGLSSTLLEGFASLRSCFETNFATLGTNIASQIVSELEPQFSEEAHDDDLDQVEIPSADSEPAPEPGDIYDDLSKNLIKQDDLGSNLTDGLAQLVNGLVSKPSSDEACKFRKDAFPRPANCDFLQAPRVNPEVWSVLSPFARGSDIDLQGIQAQMVNSVIPVARVIDLLYKDKDKMTAAGFEPEELIKTLTHSIAFIGDANLKLVKHRKDKAKSCICPKFQKLCNSTDFSGDLLFGKNLQHELKELNEGSKLTNDIQRNMSSGFRGRPRGARRWRGFRQRGRVSPYGSERQGNSKRPYQRGKGSKRGGSSEKSSPQ